MKLGFLLSAAVSLCFSAACTNGAAEENLRSDIKIVPAPNSITVSAGRFDVAGAGFKVSKEFAPEVKNAVDEFASRLSAVTGKESETDAGCFADIVVGYDDAIAPEAYTLSVKKGKVRIMASGLNGVVYAIESFKQLLPAGIYGSVADASADWTVPCVEISDAPRFGYRGMMIDVSRHFFSVDEMKKVIDVMTAHKLNRLHWHLTDDQGWRIEIKKYPELLVKGAYRKGTMIRKEWDSSDGIPYGGYFTQEQIKEVVAYAASKGIEVIPEIDLPGHMLAALATYPELGCTGGPYEVWQRWGVAEDVLCVGKEETMTFLENVLTEVMELFPSEYIHIGGDECPKVRWEKCPVCQAKIKALGISGDDRHSAEHYLQSYVTERIGNFLASHGRKIIGWDEILEGKLPDGATVMSWRGSKGGVAAARLGHDVIMTPNTHFYFDYYQSKDKDNEPFGIGGYVPLEKVYSYEPLSDDLGPELINHLLGVQANLWTEYVLDDAHLEYMLLPRLAALSEVQWCMPEIKDWTRFHSDMKHILEIYEKAGYNYSKAAFK